MLEKNVSILSEGSVDGFMLTPDTFLSNDEEW